MLTSVHSSDDIRIFQKMCRSLVQAGYEVHLVAPDRQWPVTETRGGVIVHLIRSSRSRFTRMALMPWKVFWTAFRVRGAVYHFHDPELLPVGVALKILGRRVVYDAHEDLPKQVYSKAWIPRVLRRWVSWICRVGEFFLSRALDGIIAATPAIGRRFQHQRCVVVQNFPIVGELSASDAISSGAKESRVAYVGGVSPARGIFEVVHAIAGAQRRCKVRLSIAGKVSPPALEEAIRDLPGAAHVEWLGWCDRRQVAELLASSVAGIVTFLPEPNHVEAQPNKLFEYMSAGLPVIASDFPLWREIVEGAKCGILVDPTNPHAIAEAIAWIVDHPEEAAAMGRRGKDAVNSQYNWQQESLKLLDFYSQLLNENSHHCRGTSAVH